MEDASVVDMAALKAGLARVRARRRYLWALVIVYLPTMWLTQRITGSFEQSLPVFGIWVVLLIVAVVFVASVKCPRCGNPFHVNGMTMLVLRRCLHCQLHVTADRSAAVATESVPPPQK
ncbi:hypothetical protein [Geomesophilobacter sediminis]|nr:hypothetical protein [Geomesophilobacter sediminis]